MNVPSTDKPATPLPPSAASGSAARLPWLLTLAAGVLASFAGFLLLNHREDLRHGAEFARAAGERARVVRDELRIDEALLGTVQGFHDGAAQDARRGPVVVPRPAPDLAARPRAARLGAPRAGAEAGGVRQGRAGGGPRGLPPAASRRRRRLDRRGPARRARPDPRRGARGPRRRGARMGPRVRGQPSGRCSRPRGMPERSARPRPFPSSRRPPEVVGSPTSCWCSRCTRAGRRAGRRPSGRRPSRGSSSPSSTRRRSSGRR